MERKVAKDKIKKLSLGVLNSLIDSSLFIFAFWAQSYTVASGRKDFFKAIENSVDFVREIKGERLKSSLYHAKDKGFLSKEKNGWKITKMGLERLGKVLPKYRKERPWNGKIYLITYDIPEQRKRDRDLLREYLKRMGCGMLQASVWLIPYNPKENLANFVSDYQMSGLVIVSDIGRDGKIGDSSLKELVGKVYKLEALNKRYQEFLEQPWQNKSQSGEIALNYYSILKDDPQLPIALLPKDWLGDRAHKLFSKTVPSTMTP